MKPKFRWLMAPDKEGKSAPPVKTDPDLQDALDAADQMAGAAQAKAPQAKAPPGKALDDDDADDGKPSSLADAVTRALDKQGDGSGKRDPDKKPEPSAKGDDEKLMGPQALKDKYIKARDERNRLQSELEQAKADIEKIRQEAEDAKKAALQPKAAVESEEYKALQKERDDLASLTGRLSLEHSPEFKRKHTQPIMDAMNEVEPYLDFIRDPQARESAKQRLVGLVSAIPSGAESNPKFAAGLAEVLSTEGLADVRGDIRVLMLQVRKKVNERGAALAEWAESRKKLDTEASAESEQRAAMSASLLESVRAEFEAANDKVIRGRMELKDLGYGEAVKGGMARASQEVARAISTGVISKTLAAMIHDGAVEMPVVVKANEALGRLVRDLHGKIVEYRKRLGEDKAAAGLAGTKDGGLKDQGGGKDAGDVKSPLAAAVKAALSGGA